MLIQPYPYWDLNFILYLQGHLSSWVPFLKIVSIVISPPIMFVIAMFLFFMDKPKGVLSLIFLAIITFLAIALKDIIHHPRPFWVSPYVTAFISPRDYGMPSGHTMFGFYLIFLAILYKRVWGYSLAFIGLFLVMLSRMTLGAHFAEQILAGLGLGIFATIIALVYPKIIVHTPFNFKGKTFILSVGSLLALITAISLYLEFGMYFQPRPEWVALVAQVTPKPIHTVNFLGIGASFAFSFGLFLALLFEKHYIDFTPKVLVLNFKKIFVGIMVGMFYLLFTVLILLLCAFISKNFAIILGSFLIPYTFCYTLLLEACILGIMVPRKQVLSRVAKSTISYRFRRIYDK